MPGPIRVEVHVTGRDTGGAFCLLVDHPPVGWSLPAHRHEHESETIHVVEGRFEMVVAGVRTEVGPGESVHVPRGVEHSGATIGDVPGRRVIVFAPAGMERFFLSAGSPDPGASADAGRMMRLAHEHGWRFTSP